MTLEELIDTFEKYDDDFLCDLKVPVTLRPTGRHDLNAFLMLNNLVPGTGSFVSCAEHDEIWLDVDLEELAKVISDKQIHWLVCLGIRCDGESLAMFV
jgi:hypothetical protein